MELFCIFGGVSVAVTVIALIYALWTAKKGKGARRLFSAMMLFTMGVFVAVFALFIPVYYLRFDFGDNWIVLRPLLVALHNTLRVFILDGEFETVVKALEPYPVELRISYELLAAVLYVAAPIMTFTNVLSLFRNFWGELRFRMHRRGAIFILSELNECSVALAQDIYGREEFKKKPLIVFTDVFEREEEALYELLLEARKMNAICLKGDVAKLNLASKRGRVEVFLIGEDESENVSQAVKITEALEKKVPAKRAANVKVFAFARGESSGYILDSVKYDKLLDNAQARNYADNTFKLRRVNVIRQLVWNAIPKMGLFERAKDKTVSVLLVGMGEYGIEFLKALLWYCQVDGYRLELNVIDKMAKDAQNGVRIESVIGRYCPEIIRANPCHRDGFAEYDIRCFSDVDMKTDGFTELLADKATAERLKKTTTAIIALGDDDSNVEASVYLRTVFDRLLGIRASANTALADEVPGIYSIVYDDRKSGILQGAEIRRGGENFLRTYNETPFDIHFIGSLSDQYSYEAIYNGALEKTGYAEHVGWAEIRRRLHGEMKNDLHMSEEEIQKIYFDPSSYAISEPVEKRKYQRFEYFRLSSIARAMYKEQMDKPRFAEQMQCLRGGNKLICDCVNCNRRKKSEHMRWNVYMQTIGYRYGKRKSDRAKLHYDLVTWDELPEFERYKD